MDVEIAGFSGTRVASVEHRVVPSSEYDAVRRLVAWKIEGGFLDQAKYRTYGMHYADPHSVAPSKYRAEFCVSVDEEVGSNLFRVYEKLILACRRAEARDVGSRRNNQAARYLFEIWLRGSGETWTGAPAIFHHVNVGPSVREYEAITDVYLPLI